MSTYTEEAPAGLSFDESAGDNLANLEPADEFDTRVKDDIDGLLWLGHLTDSFAMYGHHFVIKTLTRGERLATILFVKEYEDTLGSAMALETATVAACILMRDNAPLFPSFTGDEHPSVRIQSSFDEVSKWFDPLISGIFEKYRQLTVRQVQAFMALENF